MKKEVIKFNETQHNHLLGKVVLVVANDAEILNAFALSLARKGADVAAIGRYLPAASIEPIRNAVEDAGQRFLLLDEDLDSEGHSASETVEAVTAELGRLDVYIDLSAQVPVHAGRQNGHGAPELEPNWSLAQAVLKEIVPH